MVTMLHKIFCIREFGKSESTTVVQRAFRRKFNIQPPTRKSIYRWNRQLDETGSLCKGKKLSQTTVWRVLRRRLVYKPYPLQLIQALRANSNVKRVQFCDLNRHNVRTWGLQNPCVTLEHVRDSPKVNVFCAISLTKVYGPFFFDENTVTGVTYLRMLQNWLVPQMNEDSGDYIFQQDGAPPSWHLNFRRFPNESLPQQWIGRMGNEDLALQFWPPRSPDLTPCDFFLWRSVKDAVYVPLLATNLNGLRNRISCGELSDARYLSSSVG
ncbi:hypothetical protein B7P43_G06968 [Cryptotermes secundus]|uniref:DUF4817 domain-containing protein n=1 Tax=Cryptotermes secundus TaxID=105785 RepID=A0A2J7RLF5_9NEOP|nr:hypothetical protein B7P43_G06968 [Cryptotermes secundus]